MNIFVDSYSQSMHSGEISVPVSNGQIQEDDIYGNLGEVVNKTIELDNIKRDKTLFDSTGLAIQDISTAYLVYNG
jgi:alanine dehydrogenase